MMPYEFDYFFIVMFVLVFAIIRSFVRARRGERIDMPPVGVTNDLPSSVTGINKHDDLVERSKERSLKKTYDIF